MAKIEITCPVCNGAGYIEQKQRKRADKYGDLPKCDGWKYKIRKCERCEGRGFINEV